MDPDDLSIDTYHGVLDGAEKYNRHLTLQFGVLASGCMDDEDYLNQTESLIKRSLYENDT